MELWGDVGTLSAVLSPNEVREDQGVAREAGEEQVDSGTPPVNDQSPSVLQQRTRILAMSSVFAELSDGELRALARRTRTVQLATGETLRLGTHGGDLVILLASGVCEGAILDSSGKVVLSRRHTAGDLLILPVHRTGDRYVTSIHGLSDASLLTLDRDGLMEALGADVERIGAGLDKLHALGTGAETGAVARKGRVRRFRRSP